MKIMYLLFSFTIGGTERLIVDICNEMVKHDNKVYLYIVNDLYDKKLLESLSPEVVIVCKNRTIGSKKKVLELFEISAFCKKNKIDIVHCNSFDVPELLLLTKLLQRRIKILYTIHGLEQFKNINKLRIIYRNIICDSIIAISKSVKNDIVKAGIIESKISVIYNAIDTSKFEMNNKKKNFGREIVIGNVARIDCEKKGQDILLNAISELKDYYDVDCIFAGGADEKHLEEYTNLKKKAENIICDSNTRIEFIGNVDNVSEFLNNIDIFVLPSRSEGFGISLIEAMKMRVPCIASDLSGPKEIIGDNERGTLFQTNNEHDLANKIRMVIENYEYYLAKAYEAEKYVEKNFDIKEMVNKLQKLYIEKS